MTIRQIVAIRDRAVDAFGQPFFVSHNGAAIRSFGDEVNNPESPMNQHSDDYDLYHIGTYNDETGELTPLRPTMLAVGKEQLKPRN